MDDQTILYMAVTDVNQLIKQLPITSSVLQIVDNQLSQEQKRQQVNFYGLLYWYYCFTRLRDYYRRQVVYQNPDPEDYYQFSVDSVVIMNHSSFFAIKYPTAIGSGCKSCPTPIILHMLLPDCHRSFPRSLPIQLEAIFPLCTPLQTRVVTSRLCRLLLQWCIRRLRPMSLAIREQLLPQSLPLCLLLRIRTRRIHRESVSPLLRR